MTEEWKQRMAAALGISESERQVLDTGSAHPFICRCETCRQWWKAMGGRSTRPKSADEDAQGNPYYGPFTREEVEAP